MFWAVEYTDEFELWWNTLEEAEQEAVAFTVKLLEQFGPALKYPHTKPIESSKHGNMRELRSQCKGNPIRTFYAFDPRRTAILLIGGVKTGNDRFYEEFVPIADKIYSAYLKELEDEKNEDA
jgi:hypothetical protein